MLGLLASQAAVAITNAWLYEETRQRLAGIRDEWKRDFRLRLGEGIAGRVALEGRPIYVPDVLELKDFVFFDLSVRSLLTVPYP